VFNLMVVYSHKLNQFDGACCFHAPQLQNAWASVVAHCPQYLSYSKFYVLQPFPEFYAVPFLFKVVCPTAFSRILCGTFPFQSCMSYSLLQNIMQYLFFSKLNVLQPFLKYNALASSSRSHISLSRPSTRPVRCIGLA